MCLSSIDPKTTTSCFHFNIMSTAIDHVVVVFFQWPSTYINIPKSNELFTMSKRFSQDLPHRPLSWCCCQMHFWGAMDVFEGASLKLCLSTVCRPSLAPWRVANEILILVLLSALRLFPFLMASFWKACCNFRNSLMKSTRYFFLCKFIKFISFRLILSQAHCTLSLFLQFLMFCELLGPKILSS